MSRSCLLVPVDFSEGSRRALAAAVALAKDLDASLVMMHVLHPPSSNRRPNAQTPLGRIEAEINEEEAHRFFDDWVAPLRADGLDVEAFVQEGRAARAILEIAEKVDASMIVIGRQGWGRLERLRVGSVSRKVAQRTKRPLLLIPYVKHD